MVKTCGEKGGVEQPKNARDFLKKYKSEDGTTGGDLLKGIAKARIKLV